MAEVDALLLSGSKTASNGHFKEQLMKLNQTMIAISGREAEQW